MTDRATLTAELRALETKLAARKGKPGWAASVALIELRIAEIKEARNGG